MRRVCHDTPCYQPCQGCGRCNRGCSSRGPCRGPSESARWGSQFNWHRRSLMRGTLKSTCVIVGFLFVLSVLSEAQVIVHALTGTVSSMNNTTKTITVLQDNGTIGVFKKVSIPSTHLIFDKRLAAGTTDVDACKRGTYAIVFYYGDSEDPTVVALKSLGAGPFKSTTGTVERFDSRAHSLSVKDTSGAELTFEINAYTIH